MSDWYQQMREAFDKWQSQRGVSATYAGDGQYEHSATQREWMDWQDAWQAALAASQTCVAKLELPPLPEAFGVLHYNRATGFAGRLQGYTADQLREYGQSCADGAQRDKDGNHADDLRGWLDEAREQYEVQDVAFHACSLKLKHAEEELADLRAALSASDIQPMAAPDPTPGSKFMVMMDSALRHAESFGNANIATSLVREMILAYQAAALSPAPQPSQIAPDTSQEWAKLDGATAFHLIERHGDGWADTGRMMESWLAARIAADPSDTKLLDFIAAHPEMRLGYHKKRWHFKGFTNYEFDTFKTPREAIAAAIAEMSQPKPE